MQQVRIVSVKTPPANDDDITHTITQRHLETAYVCTGREARTRHDRGLCTTRRTSWATKSPVTKTVNLALRCARAVVGIPRHRTGFGTRLAHMFTREARRTVLVALAAAAIALTGAGTSSTASVPDDPQGLPSAQDMAIFASTAVAPAPKPDASLDLRANVRVSSGGRGSLTQLSGKKGCIGMSAARKQGCAKARALKGPGPFMGSRAIALSRDGKHAYVAASTSDAIAIFKRNKKTGVLTQSRGKRGCIALDGAAGCRSAVGLDGPNSVAVSTDGRSVYATSRNSNSITSFSRNKRNGSLTQVGCVSGSAATGCAPGNALDGPDVVIASNDGRNVYVGSFFGNAVSAFARDSGSSVLTQLAGTAGCIATSTAGCATGLALNAVEGLAISGSGATVYTGSAVSNAIAVLVRNTTDGSLTQASDGSGCVTTVPVSGCATGRQLAGANAVALSPNDKNVYATSLFSNSVTAFTRTSTGTIGQKAGISGCTVNDGAQGCRFGRKMGQPEGLVVSPDGRNVYATAFGSNAIDVLKRNTSSGALKQAPRTDTCVASKPGSSCTKGRALSGASSIVVSPDGKFVYATAFKSESVVVFRRNK